MKDENSALSRIFAKVYANRMNTKSQSEHETAQIAAAFAGSLEGPALLCLHGTLGMGKSVFARALIRTLCRDETLEVPSPTFTLVQTYETETAPLYHFDLYRLEQPDDIYELGWEDALYEGITLIEWPERIQNLLPRRRTDITFRQGDGENSRLIDIKENP